jgi:transcriptional regulator with XRE-family HTH domain
MEPITTDGRKTKAEGADAKKFSENLHYLMQQKGIDDKKLADDLGVSLMRVKPWTSGACFPKYTMMIQVCNYFEFYDIYQLVSSSIKPNRSTI